MKKKITTILLLVLVLLTVLPVVTAAAPYSTYTYTQDGTILLSPDAYVPDVLVDVNYMELKAYLGEHSDIANTFDFEGNYDVRDIFVGPDQKVYIVDGDHGAYLQLAEPHGEAANAGLHAPFHARYLADGRPAARAEIAVSVIGRVERRLCRPESHGSVRPREGIAHG